MSTGGPTATVWIVARSSAASLGEFREKPSLVRYNLLFTLPIEYERAIDH